MSAANEKTPAAPTVEVLSETSQSITKGTIVSNFTQIEATSTTPDLSIVDGEVTTTSNQVAQHFGKRHDTVLRAIRNLECSTDYRLRNFAASSYLNEQGKEQPCFRLTRDGFVFLAMGFTGKEAAHWKEAYIKAFNQMESEILDKEMKRLRETTIKLISSGLAPAQQRCLQEAVAKKAMSLPKARQRAAYPALWGGIKSHFQVGTYKDLSESQLGAALSFVKSYEWELVEDEPAPKKYHFPLELADPHDRKCGNAWMTPRVLTDPANRFLELELLAELEKDGHDVAGVKLRIIAMREALDQVGEVKETLRYLSERLGPLVEKANVGLIERGKNVVFNGRLNPKIAIDRHVVTSQL